MVLVVHVSKQGFAFDRTSGVTSYELTIHRRALEMQAGVKCNRYNLSIAQGVIVTFLFFRRFYSLYSLLS